MAYYKSQGSLSAIGKVQSGQSKSGHDWSRVDLLIDIPGYQGNIQKLALVANGRTINDVLRIKIGQQVNFEFTIYARQWNDRWYNNVELTDISAVNAVPDEEEEKPIQAEKGFPEGDDDLPFETKTK